jgi:hypothetical protein
MNIDQLTTVKSAGTDGAWIGITTTTHVRHEKGAIRVATEVDTAMVTRTGAAHWPLAVRRPVRSFPWPVGLAGVAIALTIEHGSYGAAVLVGVWLLGWWLHR